jgi:octaprenyl-diphosphate synthase
MTDGAATLADLYAPIHEDLARVEQIFDAELLSDHPFVNELCDRVRRYRGKMLRPALLLLCGKGCGYLVSAHHTLAAVVEMVHVATLVHDDVLDQAEIRRRQDTVNAVRGNETAVLLGDYLISHAYHLCGSLHDQYAARMIASTTNTVCEGELLQVHHRSKLQLSEAEYFNIIRSKTAALTGTCCALGARYAGGDDDTVDCMREFGLSAGVAFQIVDDILDLVGDENRTGKTLHRDLDLGKLTLPIIHSLANAHPQRRRRLASALLEPAGKLSQDVVDTLQETGSIEYAFAKARRCVQTALDQLDLLPQSPARDSLVGMAEFILRRPY